MWATGPADIGAELFDAFLRPQFAGGVLTIGDVSAHTREAQEPSLVPSPSFVPLRAHMELLRELLIDWTEGHHLLLLGVQGVGKNKLADQLLSLLSAERECAAFTVE